jgi:hypothetical protein
VRKPALSLSRHWLSPRKSISSFSEWRLPNLDGRLRASRPPTLSRLTRV